MFKFLKDRKKAISIFCILISIAFALWQMVFLASRESMTTDEKVHVPAGFSYYEFKNFYMNPEHPPLAKLIVALPVYLEHPKDPAAQSTLSTCSQFYYDCWQETLSWGTRFLYQSGNNIDKIILSARTMNIILSAILILFLAYWGYRMGQWKGAAIAAVLAGFQPIILAHGHLANTDIGITTFFAFLCFSWWQYLKQKTWKWFLISAVFMFLCAVTKFTFVIFVPFLLISAGVVGLREKHKKYLLAIGKVVLFAAIVWFLIMALYSFSFKLAPSLTAQLKSMTDQVTLSDSTVKLLSVLRFVLVPSWYFKGLFMVVGHAISGHGSYLFGNFSHDGWWYYFPATILLKTPIGFLILFVFGLLSLKKLSKQDYVLQVVLLTGIIVYLLVAMTSHANLGQRHVMPIYPLMIILATEAILLIEKNWAKAVVGVLILSIVVSVSLNYKNQIAYFNELLGGTKDGYKYLLDSNYDWGQSLKSIGNYISNKNLQNVYVDYMWESDGEATHYGIVAPKIETMDKMKPATLIVDPSTYVFAENVWMRDLPVIDRIDNTVFVLRYTP